MPGQSHLIWFFLPAADESIRHRPRVAAPHSMPLCLTARLDAHVPFDQSFEAPQNSAAPHGRLLPATPLNSSVCTSPLTAGVAAGGRGRGGAGGTELLHSHIVRLAVSACASFTPTTPITSVPNPRHLYLFQEWRLEEEGGGGAGGTELLHSHIVRLACLGPLPPISPLSVPSIPAPATPASGTSSFTAGAAAGGGGRGGAGDKELLHSHIVRLVHLGLPLLAEKVCGRQGPFPRLCGSEAASCQVPAGNSRQVRFFLAVDCAVM
ncbi:unnamed protein product [Closterium sp. NIES-54]